MFATKNLKKSTTGIALIASSFILGWQGSAKAESDYLTSLISQTVDIMNQNLPMMVDNDTRWDSSSAGPGKQLNYNYTLVNYSSAELSNPQMFNFQVFEDSLNYSIKTEVCQLQAVKFLFQNGVVATYNYYANDNEFVTQIEVSPSDCGY
ncbi:MAG: hypothetical protein Tsb0014_35540 [Pleurocapsa sp.]